MIKALFVIFILKKKIISKGMSSYRILIVEDEIIIADTIQRYLEQNGHEVVGSAISYQEAEKIFLAEKPDLALLDIRLSGDKSGVDFARFIQQQPFPIPFIYLTSQLDSRSIDQAKETFPAGYLSKPIQIQSLFATIEIAMYSHISKNSEQQIITINKGDSNMVVSFKDIVYLQSDHIYVKIHLTNDDFIIHRSSLKELLDLLPGEQFIQTHRSYAVNRNWIVKWTTEHLFLEKKTLPISRSRRKQVLSLLATL